MGETTAVFSVQEIWGASAISMKAIGSGVIRRSNLQSGADAALQRGTFDFKTLLNTHYLLVLRNDDFGLGLEGAQGFGVGEALGFLAVDAENFLEAAGHVFDVGF
jgi:hypothetical protein